jgi:hypothetical protein
VRSPHLFGRFLGGLTMQLPHVLRNNPLVLLGVVVLGLGSWFVADAVGLFQPDPLEPIPLPQQGPVAVQAAAPPVATDETPPGVVTAEVVPHLQPGMSRASVEEIIGVPPADLVHPVAEVEGRFTYRATYLANLDPPEPNTVRPVAGRPVIRPIPKSLISLEFDASAPGHPLLRVHVSAAS